MSNIMLFMKAAYYSLNAVIWAGVIGIFVAVVLYYYSKLYVGGFIRKCLKDAAGEQNAKTLAELGYFKHFLIKHTIKSGSLRHVLCVVGGNIPTIQKEGKKRPQYDFESARFYISEEFNARAYVQYGEKPKLLTFILITLFLIACAILLPIYLPKLLDIIKVPYK